MFQHLLELESAYDNNLGKSGKSRKALAIQYQLAIEGILRYVLRIKDQSTWIFEVAFEVNKIFVGLLSH